MILNILTQNVKKNENNKSNVFIFVYIRLNIIIVRLFSYLIISFINIFVTKHVCKKKQFERDVFYKQKVFRN